MYSSIKGLLFLLLLLLFISKSLCSLCHHQMHLLFFSFIIIAFHRFSSNGFLEEKTERMN